MEQILHPAESRGHAHHGWLDSYHSFSFAGYYDPNRIRFGALRVLNDDSVLGGRGFGQHPHDNMEIISIPLEGALLHQDNTGTRAVIREGDVQVMSAGTGIVHSEMNASDKEPVRFLQIWVFPDKENVKPRYDQKNFSEQLKKDGLFNVVAPMDSDGEGVKIHQDAWFELGQLRAGHQYDHQLHDPKHGVYAFVIEGSGTINGVNLKKRDGLGLHDAAHLQIVPETDMKLLLMEIPLL